MKNLEKSFRVQQNLLSVHMKKAEEFRRCVEKKESDFNQLKAELQKREREIGKLKDEIRERKREEEEKSGQIQEQLKAQLENKNFQIKDLKERVENLKEALMVEKEKTIVKNQEGKNKIKKMKTEIEDFRSILIMVNEKYREASNSQMKLTMKLRRRVYRIRQLKKQLESVKTGASVSENPSISDSTSLRSERQPNSSRISPQEVNGCNSPEVVTTSK